MGKTEIQWATHTATYMAGCNKVSPARMRCYAIPQSIRIENMGGPARYTGTTNRDLSNPQWSGQINIDAAEMARIFQGLRMARKPRRVFLNSMSDTFHPGASDEVLAELARELETVPTKHQILLLTKRPERMLEWQRRHFPNGLPGNVWAGCTVEDQTRADERIPLLLNVRARVRFLSVEPMLEHIELHLERRPLARIDWVIVGGESHRSPRLARPTRLRWVESIVRQCRQAGAAVFVKQMGTAWASTAHTIDRTTVYASGDTKGARPHNWPASIQIRQLPAKHQ